MPESETLITSSSLSLITRFMELREAPRAVPQVFRSTKPSPLLFGQKVIDRKPLGKVTPLS